MKCYHSLHTNSSVN